MDELCAEVDLTRGALYHHFGGREGLLLAVAEGMDAEIEKRLEVVHASYDGPWDAFRACCGANLDMALEPKSKRVLLRDAPAVLGHRPREIDERSSIGPTRDALAELIAAGRVRSADPEALARMLNGAMIDAALRIAASEGPHAAVPRAPAPPSTPSSRASPSDMARRQAAPGAGQPFDRSPRRW